MINLQLHFFLEFVDLHTYIHTYIDMYTDQTVHESLLYIHSLHLIYLQGIPEIETQDTKSKFPFFSFGTPRVLLYIVILQLDYNYDMQITTFHPF
jgi:hypothetical protein